MFAMFESLESREFRSATMLTPSVPIPPPTTGPVADVSLGHETTHVSNTANGSVTPDTPNYPEYQRPWCPRP